MEVITRSATETTTMAALHKIEAVWVRIGRCRSLIVPCIWLGRRRAFAGSKEVGSKARRGAATQRATAGGAEGI